MGVTFIRIFEGIKLSRTFCLFRKRYRQLRRATVKVQSWLRGTTARHRYLKVRRGVVLAQALVRGKVARKKVAKLREQHRRRIEAQQAAAK